MASGKVVFLDDSADLRVLVALMLKAKVGVECHGYESLAELQENALAVLDSDLAILDVNLGLNEPDGLEAFAWLKSQGFTGKVLFLTGHARTLPYFSQLTSSGVEVLEKPIRSEILCAVIQKALIAAPSREHSENNHAASRV